MVIKNTQPIPEKLPKEDEIPEKENNMDDLLKRPESPESEKEEVEIPRDSPAQPTKFSQNEEKLNEEKEERPSIITESSMKDTMWKLVEYLDDDSEDSKLSQSKYNTAREKPKREIEVKVEPSIQNQEFPQQNIQEIERKPSPIVEKLERIEKDKLSKEQTFGNDYHENLETIQVHDLKNIKREDEIRTERKKQNKNLVKSKPKNISQTITQNEAINPGTAKASQGNSNFEMTLKKDISGRKSELDALVKDSEDYFNSVINQMNQDINPKGNGRRIKEEGKKTGKILKNKAPKRPKKQHISSFDAKIQHSAFSISKD